MNGMGYTFFNTCCPFSEASADSRCFLPLALFDSWRMSLYYFARHVCQKKSSMGTRSNKKVVDFRKNNCGSRSERILAKDVNPCGSCGKQPNHLTDQNQATGTETDASMSRRRKAEMGDFQWVNFCHPFCGHTSRLYAVLLASEMRILLISNVLLAQSTHFGWWGMPFVSAFD